MALLHRYVSRWRQKVPAIRTYLGKMSIIMINFILHKTLERVIEWWTPMRSKTFFMTVTKIHFYRPYGKTKLRYDLT